MDGLEADGIIGLSNNKNYKNIFDLAYEKGQISTPLFAFELNDESTSSKIYYDILPESITNSITYVDTISS